LRLRANQENQDNMAGNGLEPARPPNLSKRLAARLSPETAGEILTETDVAAIYRDIFKKGSRTLKAQCIKDLWDRHFGKPKQEIGVSGGLVHAHTRDPRLATLSNEALAELADAYDHVLAKHAVPVLDVAQDGLQNQIESKPRIEAAEVDSAP
jgi:hypothetical protein